MNILYKFPLIIDSLLEEFKKWIKNIFFKRSTIFLIKLLKYKSYLFSDIEDKLF